MSHYLKKEKPTSLNCILCRNKYKNLKDYFISKCRHLFCMKCLEINNYSKITCPLGCGALLFPRDFNVGAKPKREPMNSAEARCQNFKKIDEEEDEDQVESVENKENGSKDDLKRESGDSSLLPDEKEIPVRFFESMLKLVRFVDRMRNSHKKLFSEINSKITDLESNLNKKCFSSVSCNIVRKRQPSQTDIECFKENDIEIKLIEKDLEALKENFNNFLQSTSTQTTHHNSNCENFSEKEKIQVKSQFTTVLKTGEFSKLDTTSGQHNHSTSVIHLQIPNQSNSLIHPTNNSSIIASQAKKLNSIGDISERRSQKLTLNSSMEITPKTKREELLEPVRSNRSLDLGHANEKKFVDEESDISFQDFDLDCGKLKSREHKLKKKKMEKSLSSVEMNDISELKSTIRFEQPKKIFKKGGPFQEKKFKLDEGLLTNTFISDNFIVDKENSASLVINQQIKSPEFRKQKPQPNQRCVTVQNMLLETIDEKFFETFHSLNGQNIQNKNRQSTDQESSFLHVEIENPEIFKTFNSPSNYTPSREKKVIRNLMDISDQRGIHFRNDFGVENDFRYLINAKWWRRWVDYVDFAEEDTKVSNLSSSELKFNERPGKIFNRELLKNLGFESNFFDSSVLDLKEGLLEHYDYEAVNESTFLHLKSWYGIDFEIVRYLKKDPTQKSRYYLELYPEMKKKTPLNNFASQQNSYKQAKFLAGLALRNNPTKAKKPLGWNINKLK